MAIDWYNEFVDTSYEPGKDDLVCLFYFEPAAGITDEEGAGRIASESLPVRGRPFLRCHRG